MIENRLPDYLDHMLEATKLACCYVEGMPKEGFLQLSSYSVGSAL